MPVPTPGGLALLAAAAAGVWLFRGLLFPFLAAALLAYLLNPVVAWMQARGVRREVAVIALFAGTALFLTLAGVVLAPRLRAEGMALATQFPVLAARLEATVDRAVTELGAAYPASRRFVPEELRHPGWLVRMAEVRAERAGELVSHAGIIVLFAVLVPVFAFFLLRDAGRAMTWLVDRLAPVHIEASVAVWCEIEEIIGRYLRGLALDAIAVGILAGLGLWALGVPYPILLGGFTALVNPIPYLGTVLSVGLAGLVALGAGQGVAAVGWIVGLYLAIRLVDDAVIAVVTIGGSVHLHPMLVIASILAGEQSFGLLGMVVAVPLVTVVKEVARLLLEHRRTLSGPGPRARGLAVRLDHVVC
jgi:predicted PurR-regulated permease PerM